MDPTSQEKEKKRFSLPKPLSKEKILQYLKSTQEMVEKLEKGECIHIVLEGDYGEVFRLFEEYDIDRETLQEQHARQTIETVTQDEDAWCEKMKERYPFLRNI